MEADQLDNARNTLLPAAMEAIPRAARRARQEALQTHTAIVIERAGCAHVDQRLVCREDSDRLLMLNKQQQTAQRTNSTCLSALLTALPALDDVNSERFLDSVAVQMGMTRSGLDQFILDKTGIGVMYRRGL